MAKKFMDGNIFPPLDNFGTEFVYYFSKQLKTKEL